MTNKKIAILSLIFLIFVFLLLAGQDNLIINALFGAIVFVFVFSFFYNKAGLFLFLILRPLLDFFATKNIGEIAGLNLNLASFLGAAAIIFSLYIIVKNQKNINNITAIKPWAIFLIIGLVSIIFSINIHIGLMEIIRLLSIILIYLSAFILIKTGKDLSLLVKTVIASAIIPSFFSFYQFFFQKGLTVPEEGIFNRVFGTFSHPNLFAFYLLIPISMCLVVFLVSNKEKMKIAGYGLFSLLFILALVFTYTRGAWIGLAIIILILGIFKFRWFLIGATIAILISYFSVSDIKGRVEETIEPSPYGSIQWRIDLWEDGLEYYKQRPILGHGIGTANEVILKNRGLRFGSVHPHNDYLKVALETGILGLVAYLAVWLSIVFHLGRFWVYEKRENLKALIFTVFALTISLMVVGFGDNVIRNTALQWSLWALFGGILAMEKVEK